MSEYDIIYPIMIYQIGKTGGKTLRASIMGHGLGCNHVHTLNPKSIYRTIDSSMTKQGASDIMYYRRVDAYIRENKGKIRFKFISTVREPIGRGISALFQSLERFLPGTEKMPLNQAKSRVLNHLRMSSPSVPDWFERELIAVTGFDVFSHPFDKEKGYSIYKNDYADFLILRLESLDECAKEAFEDFLGIKDFTIIKANTSTVKWYSQLYKEVKKEYRLDINELVNLYSSRYVRHFYSASEVGEFVRKWHKSSVISYQNS